MTRLTPLARLPEQAPDDPWDAEQVGRLERLAEEHGPKQAPQSRNASAIRQLRAQSLDAEADRLERLG
jgi:hypothetical protein